MQPYEPYVPHSLRQPNDFGTFCRELAYAVVSCEAVEQEPWTSHSAQEVLQKARKRKGRASVMVASLPSEPGSCTQGFMAFEAKEPDGHCTYIIALRNDQRCYDDIVSSTAASPVDEDINFQAHNSLWGRASTLPLRSLPSQWRTDLRDRRHRLIITGFSVAGAVAALATLELLESEDPHLRPQICCYTFGAPLQGDQEYAKCIIQKYASNFYHVMIEGDPIPGVLTLASKTALSKVAESARREAVGVTRFIFQGLIMAAQVSATVALNTVVPGTGAVFASLASQLDLGSLGNAIRNLIVTERDSSMPKPDYKFGGSLVLLYPKQSPNDQMVFVPPPFEGRVFENMFCVQETDASSSSLQNSLDYHVLKSSFSSVINRLDTSNLSDFIRDRASLGQQSGTDSRRSRESGPMALDNSLVKAVKSGTAAAKSLVSCVNPGAFGDDHMELVRPYLEPHFDLDKPFEVWLDNHGNISIDVPGENMVLGIHVLYKVDGKERLRVPCADSIYSPHWNEDYDSSQEPGKQTFSYPPLRFSGQRSTDITFKESSGEFQVQLAFGHIEVPASHATTRFFDSLESLKVAERFSTVSPAKLLDLLIFWATATAQAQCTAAYYAIQKKPQYADDIVHKTLTELRDVPRELCLLDQLLPLVDTSQISLTSLQSLASEMRQAVRGIYRDTSSSAVAVPHMSSTTNASSAVTFSGCYTRIIGELITKEMLSKKETAEQLAKSLDKELADGPKQMMLAYLDCPLRYKEYKKDYDLSGMKSWNKEMGVLKKSTATMALAGGSLTLVSVPIMLLAAEFDSNFLTALGVVTGLPTGMVAAGLSGSAWWLYHITSSPFRKSKKRPGLMAVWTRRERSVDNYEQKLQAAAFLFRCKSKPPHVACRLEYALYKCLKKRVPPSGSFNDVPQGVTESRCEAPAVVRLAKYGLAGAKLYEIRRYLTERKTALGLIGSTKAGKSRFAGEAFEVDSHPGEGRDDRTRVLRHWSIELPRSNNRQFTLIDFPGHTDHASPHWYIRGQLLASVLVVFLTMKEIGSTQAVDLVGKLCEIRRKDKEVSVLLCFTHADQTYETFKDEAMEKGGCITAQELFRKNFELYKRELLEGVAEVVGDADQLRYMGFHMHACCLRPTLQDPEKDLAQELHQLDVKNVQWIKDWCLQELLNINKCQHARSF